MHVCYLRSIASNGLCTTKSKSHSSHLIEIYIGRGFVGFGQVRLDEFCV